MFINRQIKDHFKERRVFTNRSIVVVVIGCLLIAILFSRLYYLQVKKNQHFSTLSKNNRVTLQAIPPTRGLIYDRNGIVLAENISTFTLLLIPEKITDLNNTLTQLTTLLSLEDAEIKRFKKILAHKKRFESIPLRFNLTAKEVAILASHRYKMPGVEVEAQLTRHYPFGKETTHVVGYVGRINENELKRISEKNKQSEYSGTHFIGKLGIEKAYEDELFGAVGFQQVEANVRGRVLRVLERKAPVPGKDIYLNIDIKLQQITSKAFGKLSGALVAIDPNNGQILSMISMPSYDANSFVNGISFDDYKLLNTMSSRPLFNRAILGNYPPGSTSKPFLALAGLEYGVATENEENYCPGYYQLKDNPHRYRDWKKRGHGKTNIKKAIIESCDVYFYDLAFHLGIDRIHQYLSLFGFGEKTGVDILGERSGLLPSREWKRKKKGQVWFPGETLNTGIGQGYMLTTPIQLASAVATLASQGKRYQTQLMRTLVDPYANKKAEKNEPREAKLLSEIAIKRQQSWNVVKDAMKSVIHGPHGTARLLKYPGMKYSIAGKTGTAQVFSVGQDDKYEAKNLDKRLHDHALFIAFAPVENPQIAVAVIVENGGHGGSVAGPIAGKVIDYYLKQSEVKKSSSHRTEHRPEYRP